MGMTIEGLLRRNDGSEDEKSFLRRRFFFNAGCLTFVIQIVTMLGSRWDRGLQASNLSAVLGFTSGLAVLVVTLCVKRCPQWFVRFVLISGVFSMALMDLHLTSNLNVYRTWPFSLLLLNVALVMQDVHLAYAVIIATGAWVLLLGLEQSLRYGLFEIFPNFPEDACSCNDPPCPSDIMDALNQSTGSIIILYLNLYLTHGFSKALWKGQREIETAISVAERIAVALAGFDIATASSALEGAEAASLPKPLAEAFHTLVANLQEYRPYLPQSCLPIADQETESTDHPDPPDARRMSKISSEPSLGSCLPCTGVTSTRRVSLVVTNLSGMLALSAERMLDLQASLVDLAVMTVRCHDGILHWFHGDHVVAVFNGAKPVTSHAKKAVLCADDMQIGWKSLPPTLHVSVVTAKALCGTIGCKEARSYGIIGHVFCWGNVLSRLATRWDIPLLCDHAVYRETSETFYFRLLLHPYLYAKAEDRQDLYEVTGNAAVSDVDEWMYEMQNSAENSPWWKYNEAVMLARRGEITSAQELLEEACPSGWEALHSELSSIAEVQMLRIEDHHVL